MVFGIAYSLIRNCHESAIADHVFLTNHGIKWDHFEILATGRSDMHCKIKESLEVKSDLRSNFFAEINLCTCSKRTAPF